MYGWKFSKSVSCLLITQPQYTDKIIFFKQEKLIVKIYHIVANAINWQASEETCSGRTMIRTALPPPLLLVLLAPPTPDERMWWCSLPILMVPLLSKRSLKTDWSAACSMDATGRHHCKNMVSLAWGLCSNLYRYKYTVSRSNTDTSQRCSDKRRNNSRRILVVAK